MPASAANTTHRRDVAARFATPVSFFCLHRVGADFPVTHLRLAFVLAFVVALAPFALDAYLPAFSVIAREFDVASGQVGLTLSIYVIAMAFGQLVGGPLSDRFGRRLVMYSGLVLFFSGSLLVAFSQSLTAMLIGRAVQAFGGGWSAVGVPAMVRDRTEGNETARLFSLIAMIMFVAPAMAPSIGTLLLEVSGWRSIFVFLAAYTLLAALLLRVLLFNKPPPVRAEASEPLHAMVTNYWRVLRHGAAMRYVIMQSMVFSIMLVYLTHASFIYQEWLEFSNATFSIAFAGNVAVMTCFSLANRRLLERLTPVAVLTGTLLIQAAAIALLAAIVIGSLPRLLAVPVIAVIIGSMGAIAPNNLAGALQYFRRLAGTATALMGATQFTVSGVIGSLSALFAADNMLYVAIIMAACSAITLALALPLRSAEIRSARISAAGLPAKPETTDP